MDKLIDLGANPTPQSLVLANGRQGQPYDQPLAIDRDASGLVGEVSPADCGLQIDLARLRICGTPLVSGEIIVRLQMQIAGQDGDQELRGVVFINPDPRTLWKNQPSDPGSLHWKPDTETKSIESANAVLVAARARGRSHAHVGSCCDDDFRIELVDDWHVIVVADGAGSAKLSRLGSKLAVESAAEFLVWSLKSTLGHELSHACQTFATAEGAARDAARTATRNGLWRALGGAAHAAMKALLGAQGGADAVALKDLSTTLLVAVARPVGDRWFCGGYWVGDGALAVWSKNPDRVVLLGEVDSGEFSGQTRFLDVPELDAAALSRRLRFEVVDGLEALVAMTDGVSDPWFETEASLERPEDWRQFWRELSGRAGLGDSSRETSLLAWLDFWSTGNHDDRTIALLLPRSNEGIVEHV